MGDAHIQVQELHKSFGDQRVLDGISLDVNRGETLAVLGRSGTGKSVLLKLLVGLERADSGSVRIGGESIEELKPDRLAEVRKKIGFLFQQGALYDSLTLEENVAFPISRHTQMAEKERQDRARQLLAGLGMEIGR